MASSFGTPSVSPYLPLPASLRASCHDTATAPVLWSRAMAGMNWLVVPLSLLSRTGGLHVTPALSVHWNMTSVLLLSFGVSDVHTAYRRPKCWLVGSRSHARFASASIERSRWAGM